MRRERFNRVAPYVLIPIVAGVTPFVFLPLLARFAGVDAWVAVALGQSVGSFAAMVLSLGLNVVGPTRVSASGEDERRHALVESFRARLTVLPLIVVAAGLLSALLAPDSQRVVAAMTAVAVTMTGLTFSWFSMGIGKPVLVLSYELLPRMGATAVAAGILIATGSVLAYPIALAVTAVGSAVIFLSRRVGFREVRPARPRRAARFAKAQWHALASEVVGGAYATLTIAFVVGVAPPAQSAIYVSGDKLYRLGQSIIGTTGNAFQVRVVAAGPSLLRRRSWEALAVHGALGLVAFGAFATLGEPLTKMFFGDAVALDAMTAVGFGIAAFALCLNTSVGRHVLLSRGFNRLLLISITAGAVVGIPSILVLASIAGSAGAAFGLAVSELTVVVVQVVGFILVRSFPVRRRPAAGTA